MIYIIFFIEFCYVIAVLNFVRIKVLEFGYGRYEFGNFCYVYVKNWILLLMGMSINCLVRQGWMSLDYLVIDYGGWDQLHVGFTL